MVEELFIFEKQEEEKRYCWKCGKLLTKNHRDYETIKECECGELNSVV
jgi:hypothetical protein